METEKVFAEFDKRLENCGDMTFDVSLVKIAVPTYMIEGESIYNFLDWMERRKYMPKGSTIYEVDAKSKRVVWITIYNPIINYRCPAECALYTISFEKEWWESEDWKFKGGYNR